MATRHSKRKVAQTTARAEVEMDTAMLGPDRTDMSTSAGGCAKNRRGERSKNQLPKETYYYISALNADGKPVKPRHVMAMFSNTCGTVARLNGPLNVDKWEDVNPNIKSY